MSKNKIQIKSVLGKVLFEYEKKDNTIKETVIAAVEARANLRGADLRGADLREADLREADLYGANLRGADLYRADLYGANLREANLRGANLREANLREAYLREAYLRGADLREANLRGADLRGANLRGANLRGANLTPIKADLFLILLDAIKEVPELRKSLTDGKIDGSCYEGACACLVGTIANIRQCEYTELPNIRPDGGRPAECWFAAIAPGDTPENNEFSRIAVEWIDEFQGKINGVEAVQK